MGEAREHPHLLINHQESEPNFFTDKWLAREYRDELLSFLAELHEHIFDVIVIGTKEQYRDEWTVEIERTIDENVYEPADLPISIDDESGVILTYTPNLYSYSEESVLLHVTAGVQLGDDIPTN